MSLAQSSGHINRAHSGPENHIPTRLAECYKSLTRKAI
ncbi:MAG: hypothetical protein JWR52_1115 [Marmoricola sp.]|nr:hypothetical protein [Marmoricola sp.]